MSGGAGYMLENCLNKLNNQIFCAIIKISKNDGIKAV